MAAAASSADWGNATAAGFCSIARFHARLASSKCAWSGVTILPSSAAGERAGRRGCARLAGIGSVLSFSAWVADVGMPMTRARRRGVIGQVADRRMIRTRALLLGRGPWTEVLD